MRLFVLARHAHSLLNLEQRVNGDPRVDVPLTPEGEEQARMLGLEVAGLPLDVCITTRFGRTKQTGEAPTQEQLDRAVSAMMRAMSLNKGVAVHCGAGLGRTGVVLAAYFVAKGATAQNAVARIRRLRPGSVETDEQAEAIEHYARRKRRETEGKAQEG